MPSPNRAQALKLPGLMNLNCCAESPNRSPATVARISPKLDGGSEVRPVSRLSRGHDRGTGEAAVAGNRAGLFGTLTNSVHLTREKVEDSEGQRYLLNSLGNHLESLGALLVDCGGAQDEDLRLLGDEITALIARSEWRDLTQPFVRVPAASGLVDPSNPSSVQANKHSEHPEHPITQPQPKLTEKANGERAPTDESKGSEADTFIPSRRTYTTGENSDTGGRHCTDSTDVKTSGSGHIDIPERKFSASHYSVSEGKYAPVSEGKYQADFSVYAKKAKSTGAIKNQEKSASFPDWMIEETPRTSYNITPERRESGRTTEEEKWSRARVEALKSLPRAHDDLRGATMMLLGADSSHHFNFTGVAEGTVGVVILINAGVMGMSQDIQWSGWETLEYFFTAFFLLEMIIKMCRFGIRDYFVGRDKYWNWFDFFIVGIALVDAAMTTYLRATQGGDGTDLGKFAQIKMLRLGRLGRLVRLLRFKFFAELKVMIQGVFAGLRVLFWAVVLFFSFIYFVAIIAVNLIGNDENPLIKESFGKVPWAMLTLFMCFTDGCTASNGTPLSYHLFTEYGAPFMVSYMLGVLFVIIGLFNLIMAIFVDNVMESKRLHRQEERAMDRTSVEGRLRRIVRQCCYEQGVGFVNGRFSFSSNADASNRNGAGARFNLDHVSVTRDMFCQLLSHKKLERVLESLDVETCNRVELFDVLDADMSGELDLEEIIAGLLSLRGPSEKKDAVGALLCGRVTQQMLKEFRDHVEAQCHLIRQEQQQLRLFVTSGVDRSQPKLTRSIQGPVEAFQKRYQNTNEFSSDNLM